MTSLSLHARRVASTDNISLGKPAELTQISQNLSHRRGAVLSTTGMQVFGLYVINDHHQPPPREV